MAAKGKYTEELVSTICNMIEADTYTIDEICKKVGITTTTYFEWKNVKPEFSEAVKKAEAKRMESLAVDARNSLRKLVNGYVVTNTKTKTRTLTNGKTEETTEEEIKHIEPNTAAVIFALTNSDPDNFKNKQFAENKNTVYNAPELTKEQLDKLVEKL